MLKSGALHCFGGELLLPASMLLVEYLTLIGTSSSLSRWGSFGLDLGPALARLGSARPDHNFEIVVVYLFLEIVVVYDFASIHIHNTRTISIPQT